MREGEEEVGVLVGVGGDNHLYFVIHCMRRWGVWVGGAAPVPSDY